MNLETLISLIDRDLDEGLSPAESRRLREFLATHGDWRRYYESLKQLEGAARAAPLIHPTPGFVERVMERIGREEALGLGGALPEAAGGPRARWERRGVVVAAVTAAVLALLSGPIAGYLSSVSFGELLDTVIYGIESVGSAVAAAMDLSPSAVETASMATPVWGVGVALAVLVAVVMVNLLVARREQPSGLRVQN